MGYDGGNWGGGKCVLCVFLYRGRDAEEERGEDSFDFGPQWQSCPLGDPSEMGRPTNYKSVDETKVGERGFAA